MIKILQQIKDILGSHPTEIVKVIDKCEEVLIELKNFKSLNEEIFYEDNSNQLELNTEESYQEIKKIFLEHFPNKYDFADKFSRKVNSFQIKISIGKLKTFLSMNKDAVTTFERAEMLLPQKQADQGKQVKIESSINTLSILLCKMNIINNQYLKDYKSNFSQEQIKDVLYRISQISNENRNYDIQLSEQQKQGYKKKVSNCLDFIQKSQRDNPFLIKLDNSLKIDEMTATNDSQITLSKKQNVIKEQWEEDPLFYLTERKMQKSKSTLHAKIKKQILTGKQQDVNKSVNPEQNFQPFRRRMVQEIGKYEDEFIKLRAKINETRSSTAPSYSSKRPYRKNLKRQVQKEYQKPNISSKGMHGPMLIKSLKKAAQLTNNQIKIPQTTRSRGSQSDFFMTYSKERALTKTFNN